MQRQYGWNDKRVANINGINSRLDEVQAAILNVKINHLDSFNKKKILSPRSTIQKLKINM